LGIQQKGEAEVSNDQKDVTVMVPPEHNSPANDRSMEANAQLKRSADAMNSRWYESSVGWFALAAIIVSILALLATFLQVRMTIKHNKLSVAPSLQFNVGVGRSSGDLRVAITNHGFGPAKVKVGGMVAAGKRFESFSMKACEGISVFLVGDQRDNFDLSCFMNPEGNYFLVGAGETKVIFDLSLNEGGVPEDMNYERGKRLGVHAYYCSMYDECKSMKWLLPSGESYPSKLQASE
jgi:hypothetical protein